jgi:E3 SUMO-protein ligase PIAS1
LNITDVFTVKTKAQDQDIVATSTVMSLKCPLSTLRIDVPCRSISCKHNQCFDAASYLQLQEQAPTWTCPVCNKPAPFEALLVDQYVDDILHSTTKNVEQVTIEPEGQWSKSVLPDTPGPSHGSASTADDDDDFVEIQNQNNRPSFMKQEFTPVTATPPNPFATARTPPLSSREQSVASSAQKNKRPASAVIDLTLSDDEEDVPRSKMPRPSLRGGGGDSMSPWSGGVHFQLQRPSSSTSIYDPNYFPSPLR